MKKILKKEVIIAFIVGIILASSIAVYAYSYAAKDVSYTKPGTGTAINVGQALNELYTISSSEKEVTLRGNSYNGREFCFGYSANEGIKKITIKDIRYKNSSFNVGWVKIGNEEEHNFSNITVGDFWEINNNNFYIDFYCSSTANYGQTEIDLIIE